MDFFNIHMSFCAVSVKIICSLKNLNYLFHKVVRILNIFWMLDFFIFISSKYFLLVLHFYFFRFKQHHLIFFFLRWHLTILPWLTGNFLCRAGWPPTHTCLCPLRAGIKGMCNQTQLNILI